MALAGSAAAWFFLRTDVSTDRLLVAVETELADGTRGSWWGRRGRPSARLADRLGDPLSKLGVDVVAPGDPEVVQALTDVPAGPELLDAAAGLGAAYVLQGTLRIVDATPLLGGNQMDYAAELSLSIAETVGDGKGSTVTEAPIRLHAMAESEEEALLEIAADVADVALSSIATRLVETERYRALDREPTELASDDLRLAGKLEKVFQLAKFRADQLVMRDEQREAALEAAAEGETGSHQKNLVGDVLAEEYFVGTAADGRIVAMTEPHHVEVSRGRSVYWIRRGHEQLVLIDPDSGERERVLETFNIFSYPSVSADGKRAVFVADHRQYSKALTLLDLESGELRPLIHDRDEYFSGPELSPSGDRVAFWQRESRRSDSRLVVMDAEPGAESRVLVDVGEGSMTSPIWSKDGASIYLGLKPDDERSSVWRVDVGTGERSVLLGPARPAPRSCRSRRSCRGRRRRARGHRGGGATAPQSSRSPIQPLRLSRAVTGR